MREGRCKWERAGEGRYVWEDVGKGRCVEDVKVWKCGKLCVWENAEKGVECGRGYGSMWENVGKLWEKVGVYGR